VGGKRAPGPGDTKVFIVGNKEASEMGRLMIRKLPEIHQGPDGLSNSG
jgi:hypothetical protein